MRTSARMLPLEVAYRSLWRAAWPLVRWYVRRKDRLRLVDARATQERFGGSHRPSSWAKQDTASAPWTLWIHGASVGECLSALPVVEFVLSPRFPIAQQQGRVTRVVVTTTTAAARRLLQQRLAQSTAGDRAVCVFAPLDAPSSVSRFYDAWRPDAGLWVESELWPTLILEASRRQIPIGILNARISDRSTRRWSLPFVLPLARGVVAKFSLVLCQDAANEARFRFLGAHAARVATNLKFASPWLASDTATLAALRQRLRGRSVWLAASTHEGEELLMARVHAAMAMSLKTKKPLLTVIIPRHPERARAIVREIQQAYPSLRIAQRSQGDGLPSADTDVFLADTLGETGLFFDAVPAVVVGGTFVPRGGHNPVEPLRAGCRVVLGPHTFNFADIIAQLHATGGRALLTHVSGADDLADRLSKWLHARSGDEDDDDDEGHTAIVTHSGATRALMQALSVQALTTYEAALIQWLATSNQS